MMMHISELHYKDVINIADGKKLGYVSDIEVNAESGCIEALILPGSERLFFFFSGGEELVIPWSRIYRIGVDVILIDPELELSRDVRSTPTESDGGCGADTTAVAAADDDSDRRHHHFDPDDDFFTF